MNRILKPTVKTNVHYSTSDQEVYDIYLAAGRSSQDTKVLLLLHGGSWIGGDKKDMEKSIARLQAAHTNHAIVNMNDVLATMQGQTAFPNHFFNVRAIINYVSSSAQEFHVLPVFGLIGVSEGAHIAMMYDYVYDDNDQVKFVATIVGPSDFTDPFYTNNVQFAFASAALTDATAFPNNTNFSISLSPAHMASATASPTLLFYGNKDSLVPLSNGRRLDKALAIAGVTHLFTVYDGSHGDNWSASDWLDVQTKISSYITTYLPIVK